MQIKFKNNVDIKYSDYITITQIFHYGTKSTELYFKQ